MMNQSVLIHQLNKNLQLISFFEKKKFKKKINEIISMRGKRGINYQNQLECLNMFQYQVKQQNFDVEIIIKILLI